MKLLTRDATIPFFQNQADPENSAATDPNRYQHSFFFNRCRISILLCVDLIVTLLCVKHSLLHIPLVSQTRLKGIVHFKIKIWYLSAYPKGIQDVGVFFSSVDPILMFLGQTVLVCQSYNGRYRSLSL